MHMSGNGVQSSVTLLIFIVLYRFSTGSTLLQTERVNAPEKGERLQQQRYQRMTPLLQNNAQRTSIG
jgi:hypothetical protein